MAFRKKLRRFFTTWRSRELEAALAARETELARLRAENRALLNSILGIAGIPPVLVDAPPATLYAGAAVAPGGARAEAAHAAPIAPVAQIAPRANAAPRLAAPLRRRSWQQIHRRLEIEAARKKNQEA